jgi:hypothetical protein
MWLWLRHFLHLLVYRLWLWLWLRHFLHLLVYRLWLGWGRRLLR